MSSTLVRNHRSAAATPTEEAVARARDWAEIQERMLVPLYEAVYKRLDAGSATRLLGIGCGSGLALLMAAARGASVTGVDTHAERIALARERLLPDGPDSAPGARRGRPRLVHGSPADASAVTAAPYNLLTAFEPLGGVAGDPDGLTPAVEDAVPLLERGSAVVLTGWGPPERCSASAVLRVATRLADAVRQPRRDDLEEVAARAGLKLDGSGRVACPFGYADLRSAVRGLLSTGLFDAAIRATDRDQVKKEVAEALHPHLRRDGTVWMPNIFRYVVARTA
ncbi:methyltransferase domain-containing protein [Streptomyces sp. NBC_01020]|uniref:methyltransferase domain-containing protein n=1 Tax=unclassified Streptomyces TaxID=2593676 RepID=UPI0022548072|nr:MULTISPECIES: methyltransferase domain-containing protein [unclassified Streptomyces]MCX4723466.1 methyltransferase domain-containing protein [Streptomyces sp. NBC_01306]WSV06935.1 methyltransferase domain-containing protein [Streptomyces sp. NBC_01020]WSX45047.1 methyltransferase domain-containing protein [Streptomyces sp. NBC_00963]WSX66929.1 methyltransferase domain-containing protein [Streptomyces sp. NBC_00932]